MSFFCFFTYFYHELPCLKHPKLILSPQQGSNSVKISLVNRKYLYIADKTCFKLFLVHFPPCHGIFLYAVFTVPSVLHPEIFAKDTFNWLEMGKPRRQFILSTKFLILIKLLSPKNVKNVQIFQKLRILTKNKQRVKFQLLS